jgi:hypothetical protein
MRGVVIQKAALQTHLTTETFAFKVIYDFLKIIIQMETS